MYLAYTALLVRVLLLGYERIVFKQLGKNSGSEESVFLIFSAGTLFLLPFAVSAPLPANYGYLWLAALNGLIYTVQTVFYVKSLSSGEASLVGPLYNFNVFFLLVLTTVFLNESLTLYKVAGLVLLVYGASFLNRQRNLLLSLHALLKDRACRYMIFSSALVAVARTIDGFAIRNVHPLTYTFTLCIATMVFLFTHLLLTRRLGSALALFQRKTGTSIIAGAVDCYSYLALMFAITSIEVSIAEPASMLGMIVTVVLAHFIFREKIAGRLVGVVIMVLGAWLLFW
ncbi:MAG: DMT family transporter [Candidatus Glassbacteria bacterium]|nr:DMT family transporter [Candidatus Glassbacteria bacterium]